MKKNDVSEGAISVAVVGLGYWGPNLLRNFNALKGCKVRAVCDLNDAALERMHDLYPKIQGVKDYEKMLTDKAIDAVVIASPVQFHYPMAKAALLAGKHVFIEKPMASSSAECEELIEIAERNSLTLMVGHTFLYSSPVRKIMEVIDSGDIGEIQYINSQRLNLGLFQKGFNVAWDLAPHDISIILHILRENPVSINCQGNAHVTPGIEDVTNMSLTFKSGAFATIQSSWLEPRKVRQMTIVGTKKMIVYDDVEPLEKIRVYDVRVDPPPHYNTHAEFHYSYHYGDSYIPRLEQTEPLKVECEHFLECIASGEEPITSGRAGLELVKILEASSISLKSGGAGIALSGLGAKPASKAG